jgi:hypothetical protein
MGTHTIPEPVDPDQDLGLFRRLLLEMARGGAAELLAVKPTTLASRIKAMGVRRPV